MKASVIGLGGEQLENLPASEVAAIIDAGIDRGVNIFDVYMPGDRTRENLSAALKGRRGEVLLQGHIGTTETGGQFERTRDLALAKRSVEGFLRHFKTDYIDLGMLFYVDTEEDYRAAFEGPFMDFALELRAKGVFRALGASSHNPITAARMVESGQLDTLMFSINPAYDMLPALYDINEVFTDRIKTASFAGVEPSRARLYELCERKGVGITVMKTLGAGWLLSPERTPFSRALTVGQCIHYALSRPAVASVLIGCKNPDEVASACGYLDLSEAERDYSVIADNFAGSLRGRCMYCNHCLPCPSRIDIAALTKLLDIARLDEARVPPTVRQHYLSLGHRADECVECGNCEGNCPFGVKVIENMSAARRIFA
jgi:predicted aldo/keto reductase-like oxidoreductase